MALWACVITFLISGHNVRAQGELPIPTHLEFVSQWFPSTANSATHIEVDQSPRLATRMDGAPSRFASVLQTLDLVRNAVGFDYSQIEQLTSATITQGVPGTVVFFTVNEIIPIEEHFASGQFPITPEVHEFHNREVYFLDDEGERPLGLYTAEGKHFVLGDWDVFKQTLLGDDSGRVNELEKILAQHSAPIIICSNPRRSGSRYTRDAPFGTVISIEFQEDTLALLMQEEHPTPDMATKRHGEMKTELPKAFEASYGLSTKKGVRYLSDVDGRHATFGAQTSIKDARPLLEHLLGKAVPADRRAQADQLANRALELYNLASAAGAPIKSLASADAVVGALCVGLDGPGGERFELPFLTAVEQDRVAERLMLEGGKLSFVPSAEPEAIGPSTDEKQIRRHARLIATLTMSAAAAESPQLKKLKSTEEIVAALCSTGFTGGVRYHEESFKGPELSAADIERVAEFLKPSEGYLVYQSK